MRGFYVVGSAATGMLRPGRSDLDFVATLSGSGLDARELGRLRRLQLARWLAALAGDVAIRRRWPLVCNGIYVHERDLRRSPGEVTPVAAHVAGRFRAATREGFDVSPVTWRNLAEHGVALRGPEPAQLAVRLDREELRSWLLASLDGYWLRWAARARRRAAITPFPRRAAAAGVLGVSRVHYTLATGEIASKPQAGRYALETFDARWGPLIEDAIDHWEGRSAPRRPRDRLREAGAFVQMVAGCASSAAHSGPGAGPPVSS